jgi:hypothetical protein
MRANPENWIIYVFPLAGLTCEEERVVVAEEGDPDAADRPVIARPSLADWIMLEKRDVADLITMPGLAGDEDAKPPMCIYVSRSTEAEPTLYDISAHRAGAADDADDLLYALWLHKEGGLPPPELACLYSRSSSSWNERLPGPYRQAVLNPPGNPYELRRTDRPRVRHLAEILRRYRTTAPNAAAEIALVNLRQSHGWYLSPADRLAMLFVALEAILGGYRPARAFRNAPMPVRAALACGDPHAERYLEKTGRMLRNAVAHGRPVHDPSDVDLVRAIVRAVIERFLDFCIDRRPEVNPTDAFNHWLLEGANDP